MHASMNFIAGRRSDWRRLLIALSVLAIHGVVIATIASFEPPPPVVEPPIRVLLVAAPEPPRPKVEPPPAAEPPPALVPPPAPAPAPAPAPLSPPAPPLRPTAPVAPPPVKPVPRAPSPRPPEVRPIPVPEASSDAPAPTVSVPGVDIQPANTPTVAPTVLTSPDAGTAPIALAERPRPVQPSGGPRTGPRIDASWAGNALPALPPISRRLRESGTVKLSVHINELGQVIDAKITSESGFPRLDSLARDTALTWRFIPATEDGKPVAAWYHDWSWNFGD